MTISASRQPHASTVLRPLEAYGISQNGFLPADPPLLKLPQGYYQPWEDLVGDLPQLVKTDSFRQRAEQLPVLDVHRLRDEPQWQRAYLILSLLAQGYIWGGDLPSERLIPSISIPFLAVADRLDLPTVATYASLNLWNWRTVASDLDLTLPQNLTALHTLTGTEDESWFYVVSNAMEARARPLIDLMLSAIAAVEDGDENFVVDALDQLANALRNFAFMLERMDERCHPQVFYHQIRPVLAGSEGMAAVGLPSGVFYEEGNGKGRWRKYRGGSNGQSSLVQFFDAVLGIEHPGSTFHQEMRAYMPPGHAKFLADLEAASNIRAFVQSQAADVRLTTSYNAAVESLTLLRNTHIKLVTRYIILPSRQPVPEHLSKKKNLAALSSSLGSRRQSQSYVGTGGSKLVPFLQGSRDETKAAIISTW